MKSWQSNLYGSHSHNQHFTLCTNQTILLAVILWFYQDTWQEWWKSMSVSAYQFWLLVTKMISSLNMADNGILQTNQRHAPTINTLELFRHKLILFFFLKTYDKNYHKSTISDWKNKNTLPYRKPKPPWFIFNSNFKLSPSTDMSKKKICYKKKKKISSDLEQ